MSLRVLEREEEGFDEVKGKKVVSDDFGVVEEGFTEKEEMVLKAKVEDDAIIGYSITFV